MFTQCGLLACLRNEDYFTRRPVHRNLPDLDRELCDARLGDLTHSLNVMAHKNAHLARSKPAYKDSEVLPCEQIIVQLRDYVLINDKPEAKNDPDHVPFDANECLCAVAALKGTKFVDYRNFSQLIKNTWVRDEVWYLAAANQ